MGDTPEEATGASERDDRNARRGQGERRKSSRSGEGEDGAKEPGVWKGYGSAETERCSTTILGALEK